MKAVRCKDWGPIESLVIEDLPDLVPGAGEVVIDVRAAAGDPKHPVVDFAQRRQFGAAADQQPQGSKCRVKKAGVDGGQAACVAPVLPPT